MRVIVARSNFLQSTLFFSIFSGNRDARFHRNLRNAMPGWLPLDAFVPSAANCTTNRRFKFKKRRQLLISVHNETLAVVAMCVSDPHCSPVGINR
jgi:hypothetical protein